MSDNTQCIEWNQKGSGMSEYDYYSFWWNTHNFKETSTVWEARSGKRTYVCTVCGMKSFTDSGD